jgi:hypothetical protein
MRHLIFILSNLIDFGPQEAGAIGTPADGGSPQNTFGHFEAFREPLFIVHTALRCCPDTGQRFAGGQSMIQRR